ncbi:hypothetical protein L6164_000232 [Bauhinia variegata]|uniref:Uncharacterized protein n=1 Tax=Bauhinia variegata TaxID=167791 RepID=A0ACB9Q6H9_BAUVA|nr:hypothetical protein L6164_000232 [Bauhinia variegata]
MDARSSIYSTKAKRRRGLDNFFGNQNDLEYGISICWKFGYLSSYNNSKAVCGDSTNKQKEQIIDTDAADACKELAGVEYIEDIYRLRVVLMTIASCVGLGEAFRIQHWYSLENGSVLLSLLNDGTLDLLLSQATINDPSILLVTSIVSFSIV